MTSPWRTASQAALAGNIVVGSPHLPYQAEFARGSAWAKQRHTRTNRPPSPARESRSEQNPLTHAAHRVAHRRVTHRNHRRSPRCSLARPPSLSQTPPGRPPQFKLREARRRSHIVPPPAPWAPCLSCLARCRLASRLGLARASQYLRQLGRPLADRVAFTDTPPQRPFAGRDLGSVEGALAALRASAAMTHR